MSTGYVESKEQIINNILDVFYMEKEKELLQLKKAALIANAMQSAMQMQNQKESKTKGQTKQK